MAKTKKQILQELDLTDEYTEVDLLGKFNELVTVQDSELNAIKSISVKTLPTVVINQEELVKRRMYGIVTDEAKGVASVINKRMVLIGEMFNLVMLAIKGIDASSIDLSGYVGKTVFETHLDDYRDTINKIYINKADRDDLLNIDYNSIKNAPKIPTKLSELTNDLEFGCSCDGETTGGVSEEEVLEIIDNNSTESETLDIGTSENYNQNSDSQIPTTKAVTRMIGLSGGGGSSCYEGTYQTLKELRDSSLLIKGATYILTDYQCTTAQENTMSAGHQFDIILTADSENTFNETARARLHKGDTYFAECNLAAWELKYCLDNDTSKFEWADEVEGKGVIYWMKDEFENECPYDFKNIQYLGATLTNNGGFLTIEPDEYYYTFSIFLTKYQYSQWGTTYSVYRDSSLDATLAGVKHYGFRCSSVPSAWSSDCFLSRDSILTASSTIYRLNGSQINYGGEIIFNSNCGNIDASLNSDNATSRNKIKYFSDGSIKGSDDFYPLRLNLIVLIGNKCHSNTFDANCYANTLSENCSYNKFESDCMWNELKYNCHRNTFGKGSTRNLLNTECIENTFGIQCLSNELSNSCYNNTFEDCCCLNKISEECAYNVFGKESCKNELFDWCCYNTFGISCCENHLANSVCYNSLSSYCSYNTFVGECLNLYLTTVNHTNFSSGYFVGNAYPVFVSTNEDEEVIAYWYTGVGSRIYIIFVNNEWVSV